MPEESITLTVDDMDLAACLGSVVRLKQMLAVLPDEMHAEVEGSIRAAKRVADACPKGSAAWFGGALL